MGIYPLSTNNNNGTGEIGMGEYKKINNITVYPIDFNLSYQDATANSTWGLVDQMNATGSNFHYIVGVGQSEQEWLTDKICDIEENCLVT